MTIGVARGGVDRSDRLHIDRYLLLSYSGQYYFFAPDDPTQTADSSFIDINSSSQHLDLEKHI